MKRLLLALSLFLIGVPAYGQVMDTAYRVVSPSALQLISNTALAITPQLATRAVRAVCTISCWVTFRASGITVPATTATGTLIYPGLPEIFAVVPGSTISVIGNPSTGSVGGTIYLNDMGR